MKNIVNDLPHVIDELRNCALNDFWNADEFGIFYKMSPESAVGSGRIPGKKKKKERLSYLVCTNADGSEKYPMLIIGRSKKPKCFGKYEGSELGFNYCSNKKAWMNSDLFFSWSKSFDDYIWFNQGPISRTLDRSSIEPWIEGDSSKFARCKSCIPTCEYYVISTTYGCWSDRMC